MRTLPYFAILALTSPLFSQEPAVGTKVADVTFPTLINGDGRQSLSEFYGQPVVIDQWGIH